MKLRTVTTILASLAAFGACKGSVNVNSNIFYLDLDTYDSCDEVQVDLDERLAEHQEKYRAYLKKNRRNQPSSEASSISPTSVSSAGTNSASNKAANDSASSGSILTNIQEKGVDEADYMKVGTHHILVGQRDGIEVVDRKSLKQIGKIAVANNNLALKLFVLEDHLIALDTGTPTRVLGFDLRPGKLPVKTSEKVLNGQYVDSRLTDGNLIVVLNDNISAKELPLYPTYSTSDDDGINFEKSPKLEMSEDKKSIGKLKCNTIVKPAIRTPDTRSVNIVSIDVADPKLKDSQVSLLGKADQIYMTQKHLYLAKYAQNSMNFYDSVEDSEDSNPYDTTVIQKVLLSSIRQNSIRGAVGTVAGYAKDQWAFNEYGKHGEAIAVATTSRIRLDKSDSREITNNLFILKHGKKNLELMGSVEDFGRTEDIRSVRYIADYAYVVTFKKTDPLFAINMKNLSQPRIESELKIPGFSTYMHPVPGGRMLGIGFDALEMGNFALFQGIQVSLFDTSNPKNVTRSDNLVFGGRGSSSEVTGDHHAFYFDPSHEIVGIPLVELASDKNNFKYSLEPVFTGAVILKIEGDKLVETARLTHSEIVSAECKTQDSTWTWWQDTHRSQDINRLFKVDGRLLTLSRWGIKSHNAADPQDVEAKVTFRNVSCN